MQENKDTTKIIPLIPLRGLVLYPETLISIDLGRNPPSLRWSMQ